MPSGALPGTGIPRRRMLLLGGAAAAWWLLGTRTAWSLPSPRPGDDVSGPPGTIDDLARRLPGMTCLSSGPWRLLTDAEPLLRTMLLQLLPATLERVCRSARTLGARPTTPDELPVVLFASRESFLDFGRQDGFDDPWALGYYAPSARRCVLCAPAESPSYQAAVARLRGAPPTAAAGAVRDRLSDWTRAAFLTTASHEAAHQVLFACGLQRHGTAYPAWLSEGLACCFETERLHGDAGPHVPQAARRQRLLARVEQGAAMPLAAFVAGLARPRASEAEVTAWYDQAALLLAWLATCRRTELARYLALHAEAGMPPTARTRTEAFAQMIGEPEAVERAWLRWLSGG